MSKDGKSPSPNQSGGKRTDFKAMTVRDIPPALQQTAQNSTTASQTTTTNVASQSSSTNNSADTE